MFLLLYLVVCYTTRNSCV